MPSGNECIRDFLKDSCLSVLPRMVFSFLLFNFYLNSMYLSLDNWRPACLWICWFNIFLFDSTKIFEIDDFYIRIRDEGIVSIGQCHSLRYLNISGCQHVGDAGITAVARGCPELSYLDVSVLQVHHMIHSVTFFTLLFLLFLFCIWKTAAITWQFVVLLFFFQQFVLCIWSSKLSYNVTPGRIFIIFLVLSRHFLVYYVERFGLTY